MANDPSRAFKWLLLVSSLVTVVFLVAAAVRENVTAEWRGVQAEYKKILLEKASDERSQRLAESFPIDIRQVVVPELDAVDRCVSCHLGMDDPRMIGQPNPHATHPGGLLEVHRVEDYGCTVCHQGQGRAMNFEEAKATDVFWPYPLLPAWATEAACASCHDPKALPEGSAAKLVRGIDLYSEYACGSCHKLDGKGGSLGPELDNVGLKTKHEFMRQNLDGEQTVWRWHAEHFRDPGGLVPDSQMPSQGMTPAEIRALTIHMLSLRERPLPQAYMAPDKIEQQYARLHPPPPDGEHLYKSYCAACHDTGGYSRWDKTFNQFVPGIRNIAFLRAAGSEYLIENIQAGRPGTKMPAWGAKTGGFTDAEIEAVAAYVRNGVQRIDLPPAPPLGSAERGREVYELQCAGCHGPGGQGLIAPALANPVFQSSATDAFIAYTVVTGRENTPMPAFGRAGLSSADIGDLLAYIRTWAPPTTLSRRSQ